MGILKIAQALEPDRVCVTQCPAARVLDRQHVDHASRAEGQQLPQWRPRPRTTLKTLESLVLGGKHAKQLIRFA